jgi:dienelactone hydrolase
MGAVFLIFGMASPLLARMTPEIIQWAMESDPATAGMDFAAMGLISEPTALSSWMQFFGDIGFLGLIALVIIFSGMLSSELSKGTLTILLTKGLPRSTVILSKFTSASIIWTMCFWLSFFTAKLYTSLLFTEYNITDLFLAGFSMWLFGMFLLALTAAAATLTNNGSLCMIIVGVVVIVLFGLSLAPGIGLYNPTSLIGSPIQLVTRSVTPRNVYPALVVSGIGIVALTLFAIISFTKRRVRKKSAILALSVILCLGLTVFIVEETPSRIRIGRYIITENITIGSGTEWELAGRLTLPREIDSPVPAVVLVHGSGAHDMDQTIFDNRPFREIAEYLSSNGIAVIRYNKRNLTHGVRMYESDTAVTVWYETIEDAILATEILKSDPRIDESRVYILGHSLGGMLAPRIHAMGGDYAGLILFAGSPRFLLDVINDQGIAYINETYDGEEREEQLIEREEWIEYIRGHFTLSAEEAKNVIIDGLYLPVYYLKDLYENPSAMFLENITEPILVMHPDDDVQVLTDVDFAMYKDLLEGRDNVTFKLYPGLNHLFMPSTGRGVSEILDEYRIRANIDSQVLRDIVEWINAEK